MLIRIEAAAKSPQYESPACAEETIEAKPTGSVYLSVSERKVSAKRYSFQAARKENKHVTATAGSERGKMMRVKICSWLQPSTLAASSNSLVWYRRTPSSAKHKEEGR